MTSQKHQASSSCLSYAWRFAAQAPGVQEPIVLRLQLQSTCHRGSAKAAVYERDAGSQDSFRCHATVQPHHDDTPSTLGSLSAP